MGRLWFAGGTIRREDRAASTQNDRGKHRDLQAQIKSLGFSYDWSREVDTTDPKYFKWTQWIFLQLYNSWFNPKTNKAEPIETLEYPAELERASEFHSAVPASTKDRRVQLGSTLEQMRRNFRDSKRLAYVAEAPVNWCEELGTVLANEEVIDGKSDVGGFLVVRKPMRQWMLRITAYAERLLDDLEGIDWSHSLKEMQRNWIGRSEGASVEFQVLGSKSIIGVFTTRPDTLFGATYLVLSPEHKLVNEIVGLGGGKNYVSEETNVENLRVITADGKQLGFMSKYDALNEARRQKKDLVFLAPDAVPPIVAIANLNEKFRDQVEKYKIFAAGKSELERTELAKEKTGVFTGAFAINPANGENIPIWIADYVLASYGTGAIMAVPAHDTRDFEFAEKFKLAIVQVVQPLDAKANWQGFVDEGTSVNSTGPEISITGLPTVEAKAKITDWLESKGLGKKTINYKLRDWLFSRQRYWGEPFPIIWKRDADGNLFHEALPESALPVVPPELTDYKPAPGGEPPLARAKDWVNLPDGSIRETNTMPQWGGSCWYYLRYLDAQNPQEFVSKAAENYWMGADASTKFNVQSSTPGVDLYVGGTEHAVLHLLYARFWHKVLFDLDHVSTPEPFFKLVNQGLILGENGQKMSKSLGNVVNPDDIMSEYGADALRLYEMFMGPLEMVKPWNTHGVAGVYKFLGRVWRLFVDEKSEVEYEQAESITEAQRHGELLEKIQLSAAIKDVIAAPAQLKTLHACIKKVTEDLDGMRFNTAISALMVFVNDAISWETKPVSVLRDFLILLQPFAPHLAEELWEKLNIEPPTSNAEHRIALAYTHWPKFDAAVLVENEIEIPVQVNGKLRDVIKVPADISQADLETAARASEKVKAFIDGKTIKKVIVVPKKLVNIAVA